MVLSAAVLCLALNVYHEARGEMLAGQLAVALVTMNRARDSGRHICHEVFAPRQFSWTNTRAERVGNTYRLKISGVPTERRAWEMAKVIARTVLNGEVGDITNGSKFYHSTSVRPIWRHGLEKTILVGNHQFYREKSFMREGVMQ